MARWDKSRKIKRNQAVKEYRLAHPELALSEIGEEFGVCAARIYRIINGNQKRKPKR